MRVNEVGVRKSQSCGLDASLARVAEMMAGSDLSIVVLVDAENKPAGIVTHRGILRTLAQGNRPAVEVKAREAGSARLFMCQEEDLVLDVLQAMRAAQSHEIPVVDAGGMFQGVLSVYDVVEAARSTFHKSSSTALRREVMLTLMTRGEGRLPQSLGLVEPRTPLKRARVIQGRARDLSH